MAAMVASLAWMLARSQRMSHACPSLLGVQHVVLAASCKILIVVAKPFTGVTWWLCSGQSHSGKTASVLPACTIYTGMSSGPRSMLKATVNVAAPWCCPAAELV